MFRKSGLYRNTKLDIHMHQINYKAEIENV